jgi:hypothetical protein
MRRDPRKYLWDARSVVHALLDEKPGGASP